MTWALVDRSAGAGRCWLWTGGGQLATSFESRRVGFFTPEDIKGDASPRVNPATTSDRTPSP
jgi:hypothetical protein